MPEQSYLIFNPTRFAYLKWYLVSIFLTTFSVYLLAFAPNTLFSSFYIYISVFFIVAGLFLFLVAEVSRKHDKYAITNYRVIEKSGIINIDEESVYWEKLSNYEIIENLFDRIFHTGTVKLWSTGGEDEPEVIIEKAPNIKKIRFFLDKFIQKR